MRALVERQRAHFNGIAERYHAARRHPSHLALKRLIWSEFLKDKGQLKVANLRVLDAMCGHGDANSILREHLRVDIDYAGFDYSDEVVARLRRDNPALRVWQEDATAFSSSVAYDLIVLLGGLHHVHHSAPEVVKRLSSALRPSGHFLSFEPTHGNRAFAAARAAIYRRNSLFEAETERGFAVSELFAMFREAGLAPVDVLYPGLLSYVLYYNPDAFPMLNVGGPPTVNACFALERPIMRSALARVLSFSTLSLWRKP